jgi:hypothetical protein
MEMKQEQLDLIFERAKTLAAAAVEENAPSVVNDLGRQMADSPSKNEIVLKINVTFRCLFNSKWELDCAYEWEQKIKRKDSFDTETLDFDQPELPGIKPQAPAQPAEAPRLAIDTTARPVLQLTAGPAPEKDARCLCGHRYMDHDNGQECDECVCECFEQEEQEQPSVTPERQAELKKACAYAEVDEPAGEIIDPSFTVTEEPDQVPIWVNGTFTLEKVCTCGHGEHEHNPGWGSCLECQCSALDFIEPKIPHDGVLEFLQGYFKDNPKRARNLEKISARGVPALIYHGAGYSILYHGLREKFLWDWRNLSFTTKAKAWKKHRDLLDAGAIDLVGLGDEAKKAGFHMLRARTDGIFALGLKGLGWCKVSDARGPKAEAEMVELAKNPLALED